jgi:predicted nucleotidyltransferase
MKAASAETNLASDHPAGAADFAALRDARYPVHRIAGRLEPYLRALVERIHPARIILFGSYACGQPDMHSDVDLLVVRPGIASRRDSDLEIARALRGIEPVRLPFTILSVTPERLEWLLAHGSHFYDDILRQGVELYAA